MRSLAISILVVSMVLLTYSAFTPVSSGNPGTQTTGEGSEGATMFRENCAACHANDGSGDSTVGRQLNVPDLRSEEIQAKADEQLIEAIAGVQAHPDFQQRIGEDGIRRAIIQIRMFGAEQE